LLLSPLPFPNGMPAVWVLLDCDFARSKIKVQTDLVAFQLRSKINFSLTLIQFAEDYIH
jgi:hypothetical protein